MRVLAAVAGLAFALPANASLPCHEFPLKSPEVRSTYAVGITNSLAILAVFMKDQAKRIHELDGAPIDAVYHEFYGDWLRHSFPSGSGAEMLATLDRICSMNPELDFHKAVYTAISQWTKLGYDRLATEKGARGEWKR